jgi:hypothetical protein
MGIKIHSRRTFLWKKIFKVSHSQLKNHLRYEKFSNVGYLSATIGEPPLGEGYIILSIRKASMKNRLIHL